MSAEETKDVETSLQTWVETAVYVLTSAIAAYAMLRQAGVEIDFTPVTTRYHRAKAAVEKMPWLNPKRWRRMVNEVLLEAWIESEGES